MFNDESSIYGLKYHTRCLTSVPGQPDTHEFMVGTSTLKDENEIHLIDFDERINRIICRAIFRHEHEVWHLSSCTTDPSLVFTVANTSDSFVTRLWKASLPNDDREADDQQASGGENMGVLTSNQSSMPEISTTNLQLLGELDDTEHVQKVVWNHGGTNVVSVDKRDIRVWSLEDGGVLGKDRSSKLVDTEFTAGTWDPHHGDTFVTTDHTSIRVWDIRNMSVTSTITQAHNDTIRDVDHNPNKPYHVATGGEDRRIKFWDLRKPDLPLKVLTKHTHWVWNVKHNPFHDQLVLSCGTDSTVNLWSMVSVSSAPLGELEDPANEKEGDKLVKTYDEHEDSVYAVAWSACDAWIFASLSYGGRVVVNHVPPAEKYKILL